MAILTLSLYNKSMKQVCLNVFILNLSLGIPQLRNILLLLVGCCTFSENSIIKKISTRGKMVTCNRGKLVRPKSSCFNRGKKICTKIFAESLEKIIKMTIVHNYALLEVYFVYIYIFIGYWGLPLCDCQIMWTKMPGILPESFIVRWKLIDFTGVSNTIKFDSVLPENVI